MPKSADEIHRLKFPIIKQVKKHFAELSSLPWFVPRHYVREVDHGQFFPKTKRTYQLNILQRIFVTFDYGVSCVLASLYSTFMVIVILFSVVVYILTTDPGVKYTPETCDHPACDDDPVLCPGTMVCEPVDKVVLDQLDLACLCFFLMDYVIRVALCPLMPGRLLAIMPSNWDQVTNATGEKEDPEYRPLQKFLFYVAKGMNVIDLVAIITGYLAYFTANETGSGFAVARVLRLARVFRVFKFAGMSKGVPLFTGTIKRSMSAVRVMFFFSLLAVVVFATIMYFVESGDFEVSEEHPEGAYMRWDYVKNVKEISPFKSILVSMYWAIVTTTTVGYGDFHPTSGVGRFLACVYMYFGIVMLALPISVVGTNFQREYELHYPDYIEKELKIQKKRQQMGLVVPDTIHQSRDSVDVELSHVKSILHINESENDTDPRTNRVRLNELSDKVDKLDTKLDILINEMRILKDTIRKPPVEALSEKCSSTGDESVKSELHCDESSY